jgi:hypothetical protein
MELKLRGESRPRLAARAFAAFAEDLLHDGTTALAQAWLAEAGRRRDDGARDDVRAGLAAAYVHVQTPEQQLAALSGLARLFRDDHAWDSRARLLDRLDRTSPDLAAPEIAPLRVDAALARRDLAAVRALRSADAPTLAVADALAGATATVHRDVSIVEVADDHVLARWGGSRRRTRCVAPRPRGAPR